MPKQLPAMDKVPLCTVTHRWWLLTTDCEGMDTVGYIDWIRCSLLFSMNLSESPHSTHTFYAHLPPRHGGRMFIGSLCIRANVNQGPFLRWGTPDIEC